MGELPPHRHAAGCPRARRRGPGRVLGSVQPLGGAGSREAASPALGAAGGAVPAGQQMQVALQGDPHVQGLLALMLPRAVMTDWDVFSIPTSSTLLLLSAGRNQQVHVVQTDLFSVQPVREHTEPKRACARPLRN